MHDKTCHWCGRDFRAQRPEALYCSPTHRTLASKARSEDGYDRRAVDRFWQRYRLVRRRFVVRPVDVVT